MKKQKPARLFRALIVSSTLSGLASQVHGQEGVANTAPPGSDDGVATLGQARPEMAAPPTYPLPQYVPQFNNGPDNWFQFGGDGRNKTWQEDIGPRFMLETRIGEQLGSDDDGDVSINFLQPWRIPNSDVILFADIRGTATYNGRGAANVGLGARHYDASRERVYGLSFWYDYDNGNAREYHQLGLSFQSVGHWFDFYVNGYLPVSDDRNVIGTRYTNPVFSGNAVMIDQIDRVESAYSGFNAEVGGPLPILGRYGFRGYVGGYYFQADDDKDVSGPSMRIEANVTDDVKLGINVTHDNVFDTQVFGTVALTLPDGRPQTYFRQKTPAERLLARDERRYRATVNRREKTTQINGTGMLVAQGKTAANNSGLNAINVSNIVFVDPNALANGTGTFENPLKTFVGYDSSNATKLANTLFVIDDGDLTGQLTLQTNSRLFSVNYINSNPVLINTPAGQVALPPLDLNAVQPVWSNPTGGTLVTIAGNNTEIAGITFDGRTNAGVPAASMIAGTGIAGFSIHDNTFRNYRDGITLNNATGTIAGGNPGLIYSNFFFGQAGVSRNALSITNNGNAALDLELGATEFTIRRSNGTALGNFASGNTGEDANGNGILDAGEDGSLGDAPNGKLDGGTAFAITARNNAVINANVVANVTASEDTDRDGVLDTEDLNRNGVLDPGEDTNNNGVLDFNEDFNRNGRLDSGNSQGFAFEVGADGQGVGSAGTINLRFVNNLVSSNVGTGVAITSRGGTVNANGLGEDVNANGMLDGSEDRNANGRLDFSEDLNNNGVLDVGEDKNGNGKLDLTEDTDGDGLLDLGEDGNEDLDGNGKLDIGEDRNGDGFLNRGNGNGLLDGGRVFAGNQIIRNGGNGLQVDLSVNGNVSLLIVSNEFGQSDDRSTGNRGRGLDLNASGGILNLQLGYVHDEDKNFNGILDIGEDLNGNNALDIPLLTHANDIVANRGGGVNFNLTGDAIGSVGAIGNTIEGIGGGNIGFLLAGDTTGAQFDINNNSLTGLQLSRFQWDIAAANLQFNTTGVNGVIFQPVNSTDTATGLTSVNGTSNPFVVNNLATTLDLGFNNFDPRNGKLDTGEDVNNNGALDNGEDLGEIFSFQIDVDRAGVPANVFGNEYIGSVINATFASGQVLTGTMQAVAGNALASQFVVTSNNLGTGNGFGINVGGQAVLNSSVIRNNSISHHGGNGVLVTANGSGSITDLLLRSNTIEGNGSGTGSAPFSSGVALRTAGSGVLNAQVLLNTINNNQGGAIDVFANGGSMDLRRIEQNTIDGNGSGISLSAAQAATLHARVTNNNITNSVQRTTGVTTDTTGNGLIVNANNATVILDEIALNTISGNNGDGINFDSTNAGVIRVTASEDFNRNNILDPGEDANEDLNNNGVRDANEPDSNGDGFFNLGNGNGLLDRGILNNSLTNNDGLAFGITTTGGTVDLAEVRGTAIVTNTTGTGNISIVGKNGVIRAAFRGNNIVGDFTNNPAGGPGLLVSATGGSFDVDVGGTGQGDGNIFSGNRGAGVAFVLSDTGTGSFTVVNNTITRIADDNDVNTPLRGDGINVSLVGSNNIVDATAVLTRSDIVGNIIGSFTNLNLGVQGSGIAVLVSEQSRIQDLLVESNQIGHAGSNNVSSVLTTINPNSSITGDGDAGIKFERFDDARLDAVNPRAGDTVAVNIRNNIVRNNTGANNISPVHGLLVNVMNGIRDDIDFQIDDNEFGGNTGNGIQFETQADASLAANLRGNLIENNLLNGIHGTSVENIASDLATLGGTWIQNEIRGNALNGIQLSGVSGDVVPLIIGQLGNNPLTGLSLGNYIHNNGVTGIRIEAGGFSQINNNIIERNNLHGIDIEIDQIGLRADTLRNNSIVNNGGDGLQWRHEGGFVGDTGYLLAYGNSIDGNTGRGVDILSMGLVTSNIQFGDDTLAGMNHITSNGLEGFYVVNTASRTQRNDVDSSTPLAADGSVVFSQADMVLDISRNEISANNNLGDFIGGGVILRAGTNNGGGFPSIFFPADATGTQGRETDVGTNDSLLGNGRINARVVNNTFNGNLGDDVYIESFTSTVDPVTAAGTWDDMQFTIMTYQHDPLARLNLVFRGNTGDAINVATGQGNQSALPGQSPDVGAFYNDGDGVFKSRLNTANPGGPFTAADRRRNAQRIAWRTDGVFTLAPAIGGPPLSLAADAYEYPGMGPSTFRIESDFDVSGFQSGDTFFLDGVPYDPFGANGVGWIAPVVVGELPFGWGTAAPGTFQFDQAFIIP